MSQTETGKALAAEERTEEAKSFVRRVKAATRQKHTSEDLPLANVKISSRLAVAEAMPQAPLIMWRPTRLEVIFRCTRWPVLSVLLPVTPAYIGMPSGSTRAACHPGFRLAHDP